MTLNEAVGGINTLFEKLANFLKKITAVMMMALVVVVTIQIVGRMAFTLSTPWTEELAKYLLIWISFVGGVVCLIKGEHLLVDILYVKFSPRLKKYARLANDVIVIAFTCVLLVGGIQLCTNPIIRRSLTPAMQMPRVWLYYVLPVTMGLMMLYAILDLVAAIVALSNHEKEEIVVQYADESKTLEQLELEEAMQK